jgi:hypothetical protein
VKPAKVVCRLVERCHDRDCAGYERCAFSVHRSALDETRSSFKPEIVIDWEHERPTNLLVPIVRCLGYRPKGASQ